VDLGLGPRRFCRWTHGLRDEDRLGRAVDMRVRLHAGLLLGRAVREHLEEDVGVCLCVPPPGNGRRRARKRSALLVGGAARRIQRALRALFAVLLVAVLLNCDRLGKRANEAVWVSRLGRGGGGVGSEAIAASRRALTGGITGMA